MTSGQITIASTGSLNDAYQQLAKEHGLTRNQLMLAVVVVSAAEKNNVDFAETKGLLAEAKLPAKIWEGRALREMLFKSQDE